jgi:transcriptional regulator with XRE-family HTH domain
MLDTQQTFGQRVRMLRLQRALTQAELADKAGLARSTILNIENDAHPTHPGTVRKIARALGVSPMQLTTGA